MKPTDDFRLTIFFERLSTAEAPAVGHQSSETFAGSYLTSLTMQQFIDRHVGVMAAAVVSPYDQVLAVAAKG